MKSKLIGREVTITSKDSWAYGEWGIIKFYDGEDYHIALYNDDKMALVFSRNEFRVKRNKK